MFTTRPELAGTFGMVTSTHWIASAVGMSVLERGGNAFDAAVAVGFALQIVEPHLNGPGGEVPILLHAAASGETRVLCGQGVAPQAATIERCTELGIDVMPGTGLLSAVVPGAFDAWLTLLRDYGTWTFGEVLAPAIFYAENGFPLVPAISQAIASVAPLFEEAWPSSAALYLTGGEAPRAGTLFRNPVLAETWRRLVREAGEGGREAQIERARRAWYQGFVAEAIDDFCRNTAVLDTSGERHFGLLTGQDLADWQASYEAPLSYDYHGLTVCKTGPWGQGPAFLQQLALLDGFDIAAMPPRSAEFVHTVVECAKLAFLDREAYYGDPNFVDVPLETLLSRAYNDERRRLVGAEADLTLRPGSVDGRTPRLAAWITAEPEQATALGVGEPSAARLGDVRNDTCHLDIIDRHGNMVSATPSGGWLQSSPAIPELGFALTTRGQMFWLEPGLPASLAPGKRPRTTLSPTLVLRDGRPVMAFGTPGGDQQDQWSLTFFLRVVHHGLNLQEAIDTPMFHTSHFPNSFWPRRPAPGRLHIESRFDPEVVAELARRGHEIVDAGDWGLGRLAAATLEETESGPLLKAAANPRFMQNYAVGR